MDGEGKRIAAIARVASLPELRTYNCEQCGVTVTEAEEPRERRDAPLLLDHRTGGDPAMNTQIASKSSFANNFWLQMTVAVLVIAMVVLIAVEVNSLW